MSIECYSKDLKGLLLWVKDTTCGWTKDRTATHRETDYPFYVITFPVKSVKFGKSGNKKTQIKKYLQKKGYKTCLQDQV